MTASPESGTLGNVQLLAFTHDASSEAIRLASQQLGYDKIEVKDGTIVQATEHLKQHASPINLLVEVTSVDDAPAQLDALADVLNPNCKVIVCGKIDSVRFYHWLLEIGIHEYLLEPFTESELVQALKADVESAAKTKGDAPKVQKLIAVIGARGGVGTTTIAVNMAAMFAKDHQLETALFDLDAYFGSVALTLDVEPGRGLRDALEKPDRVDGLFLDRVMVKPFTGLAVLSGEEPLTENINAQANAGETIIGALRSKFPIIVVDMPRQVTPFSRYILGQADHVIIVAEPQLGSLRDALRVKDYLVEGIKRPAPLMVLNRMGAVPKHELPIKDFVKHYGHSPTIQFPYLTEAIAASADGTLLVDNPKTKAALAPLKALTARLAGIETTDKKEESKNTSPAKTTNQTSFFSKLKPKK